MTADINSQELKTIINKKDWDQLLQYVKPKYFVREGSEAMPDASILAQMCQLLVSEDTSDEIKILCLKCVGNSCIDSYKCKRHTIKNVESVKYSKNLYDELVESDLCKQDCDCDYPHDSHFPYDGVIEWAVDYVTTHGNFRERLFEPKLDIFRLSVQFLSNLLFMQGRSNATFADNDTLSCLNCNNLKRAILRYTQYGDFITALVVADVACKYVYNALQTNYLTMDEKDLCKLLLKPSDNEIPAAIDALFFLLRRPNVFEDVYSSMTMSDKILLLDIIHDYYVWESWESNNTVLKKESAEFLALTFCKKSDLILKTVDTYVNSVDPTEIILILQILGFLTIRCEISENVRCLLINCKYLLMSLHMMGKEADNYFTPITQLSKSAPHAPGRSEAREALLGDPEHHPAYGFKAGLIRVIANVVYRNKMCQDLFREIDGIPLLLDCTSIDARNPLISQWTTLALRNLCEDNPENQEIIKKCKKTGVSDNPELKEMGLTLHEDADGKSIRIAPLQRD
ncbi:ataxin-10 [Temnothorax curvispinosus]|uniref:Ataxin-10 n=1 Tax=Temnothorax curvispinosus TaxID=300111 RepID=A0A6J1R3G3_9HYME|nr:ataxin-10 [Temnothorax curvispinosus]